MNFTKYIVGATSLIKLLISKVVLRRNIEFTLFNEIKAHAKIITNGTGTVKLGKSIHLYQGTQIKSNDGAIILIGQHTSFNNGCMIVSREKIDIGSDCSFGPNVMIYDHDHDYKGKNIKEDKYITNKIVIGSNVWVGAGAMILRGSTIGNNVVVGAGTIVKGDIPDNTLVYQKKEIQHILIR
nr:acyltransferase [uncultured Anaerobutyricum sp.]